MGIDLLSIKTSSTYGALALFRILLSYQYHASRRKSGQALQGKTYPKLHLSIIINFIRHYQN